MRTVTGAGTSCPAAALRIRSLSKDYGPVRVVNGVSLEIHSGRVHALLGENGAGKSTLIKMLAGVVGASAGHLEIDGEEFTPRNVKDAQGRGIVALPQELSLVPGLTAPENIFLGLPQPTVAGVVRTRHLRKAARAQLQRLGQEIPLGVPVGELSAVSQTMVALARALARDARVLILDEPTASLTDTEIAQLFAVLRKLRREGTAIIYVSHRLEEVFDLADTVTVMRNGAHVWTKQTDQTSPDDVIAAMIGRRQEQLYPGRDAGGGPEILTVTGLWGARLRDVSLRARAGRVLGIAGLAGSGRSELLRILAGAQKAARGRIEFDGATLGGGSVRAAMAAGVVLVPEERRRQGLVLGASVRDNISLANLGSVSRFGVLRQGEERGRTQRKVDQLGIRATSLHQFTSELSGGNQQKVVLARYLERNPRLLLLDEPTRGIDVGTKAEIYRLIRTLAETGVSILVVSSEIPELLGIADDIAVLHAGRLTATLAAATTDEATLLQHCYGRHSS